MPRLPGKSLRGTTAILSSRIGAMYRDAPTSAKRGFSIRSARRDTKTQAILYKRFKAGGNIAARPGHSKHESGQALDLVDPSGWFHKHASEYGLQFGVPGKGGKKIDLGHFTVGGDPTRPIGAVGGYGRDGTAERSTPHDQRVHDIKKNAIRARADQSPGHEAKEPERPHKHASQRPHHPRHEHPKQERQESGKWAPKGPSASAHPYVRERYNKREHPLNYRLGDTA